MNPARDGLTTAGKAGIVVILVVLVVAGVYFAPSMLTGGATRSTSPSQSTGSSSSSGGGGSQTIDLLTLFGHFSQMKVQWATYDHAEGAGPTEVHTVSYQILGKASLNSTQYTKVHFSQAEATTDVIVWFNPQGGIDRVDVLGVGNHTGGTANVYAEIYVAALSVAVSVSNNATLFSLLSKTTQTTTSINSTQLDVVTYTLKAPTPPYTSITARYATIPGTNMRLALYVDENMSDMTESTVQILSLSK